MSIHLTLARIAQDHGFSYRIDSGVFYVGIEHTWDNGAMRHTHLEWFKADTKRDLLTLIGY